MMQEVLAVGRTRSAEYVLEFLDRFLPDRTSSTDEFSMPELEDDPEVTFDSDVDALGYLASKDEETYALYWNARDQSGPVGQAMAYFLEDGHVLLGLAVRQQQAEDYLGLLAAHTGSEHTTFGSEQRPGDTLQEFVENCRR